MCIGGYDPGMSGRAYLIYQVTRDPANLSCALGHMLSWLGCRQGEARSFLNLAWWVEETKISLNCTLGWKHWLPALHPDNKK